MKHLANFVDLSRDDIKARSFILDSLEVTSHDYALSRKLLERWAGAGGNLAAIFGSGIDLGLLSSYDCCWPVPEDSGFHYAGATPERTHERMARFVAGYLTSARGAVAVCEEWMAGRADLPEMRCPRPRTGCLGDEELYYVLTSKIADLEAIEDAVRPGGRYQTGVCSTSEEVPEGDVLDEGFLDEVARNARQIFVPAFDGSGYLIWSLPGREAVV
jgi:hypothetical protein